MDFLFLITMIISTKERSFILNIDDMDKDEMEIFNEHIGSISNVIKTNLVDSTGRATGLWIFKYGSINHLISLPLGVHADLYFDREYYVGGLQEGESIIKTIE